MGVRLSLSVPMNKTCTKCKLEKPLSEFNKCGNGKTRAQCKSCCKIAYQLWKANNPEGAKNAWKKASVKYYSKDEFYLNRRLRKYGLTFDEYEKLETKQEKKCAICKAEVDLVIDHCHNSLEVRGLLCSSCNSGLGFFRDDIEALYSAIEYLNCGREKRFPRLPHKQETSG